MTQIFKPIPNYNNLYEISNQGTVRALDRYNTDKNGKVKFYPGKILKQDINHRANTSYARVTLSKDGETKRFQVHQLVLLAFIGPVKDKPYVNHIDNNGLNNYLENLEWCTHSENMVHAQKQGRLFNAQSKGGTVGGNKLSKEAAEKAKSLEGKTIGIYTVLNYINRTNETRRHYLRVQCGRCGGITELIYTHVTNEKNKHCNICRGVLDKNFESWKKKRGI